MDPVSCHKWTSRAQSNCKCFIFHLQNNKGMKAVCCVYFRHRGLLCLISYSNCFSIFVGTQHGNPECISSCRVHYSGRKSAGAFSICSFSIQILFLLLFSFNVKGEEKSHKSFLFPLLPGKKQMKQPYWENLWRPSFLRKVISICFQAAHNKCCGCLPIVFNQVLFSGVKGGQKAFREFLKSEFCEENLDFLLACQNFQTLQRPEERKKKAAKIYEEFIRDDSPKQVNLDFNTTKVICQSLQQPGPSCFVVAQKKIFSLMENDSFSRFLQSEHYKVLTGVASKPRGLRKHRAAMRIKSAGDELEVNRLQDGLLLWHEH
uniref:RGS domain-containing protein n=1 Tax=Oryzias sinensis TaxID=183150 RepID=A0A8C7XH61_9TELE